MVSNTFSYSPKQNKMADIHDFNRVGSTIQIGYFYLLFHFARFYSSTYFLKTPFTPIFVCVRIWNLTWTNRLPNTFSTFTLVECHPHWDIFFLTSIFFFFFQNLFDNTVISFLDRDRQKAFFDIYQDRKVRNVSSRGRSTL